MKKDALFVIIHRAAAEQETRPYWVVPAGFRKKAAEQHQQRCRCKSVRVSYLLFLQILSCTLILLTFFNFPFRTVDLDDDEAPREEATDGSSGEDDDLCLGLSYRRGLRKGLFEKPRGHLLSTLGGDLWGSSTSTSATCSEQLEKYLAANNFTGL